MEKKGEERKTHLQDYIEGSVRGENIPTTEEKTL